MKKSFGTKISMEECWKISGGEGPGPTTATSVAYDISYTLGKAAKCLWYFCKTAVEYQASLPPNLKK